MSFYRDAKGNEVDVVVDVGGKLFALEIKSGQTVSQDYFKGFKSLENALNANFGQKFLVYGGTKDDIRSEFIVTNPYALATRLTEFGI